jgi:putative colanic acid biosynthesis UDP-glucose lipid carrier transferase
MEVVMSDLSVEGVAVNPIGLSSEPPVVRFHHSKILALFRALDSALIVFMLWGCLKLLGLEWNNIYTGFAISAVIIFGFFAESNEVYYLWRGHSMIDLSIEFTGDICLVCNNPRGDDCDAYRAAAVVGQTACKAY